MTSDSAVDIVREALVLTLLIGGPILMVGLIVGLIISLIQALTQVQEQTLSFVPKLLGMVITIMLLAPWMSVRLSEFAERMFAP